MPDQPLLEERRFYQSARFWRWMFVFLFLIVSGFAFRKEIRDLWYSVESLFKKKEELAVILARPEIETLGIIGIAFLLFFFVGLLAISQFVLPVQRTQERGQAFNRILRYLIRRHGPALFIKEAEVIGQAEEIECSYPGVMFVDLCSAIALENQRVMAPRDRTPVAGTATTRRRSWLRLPSIFRRRRTARRGRAVRVAGPGLVFTERGERLRGVADLRRQIRFVQNASFATRDGFSVFSNVFIIFSLGDKPDVLKVACLGDKAEDIRSVQIDQWTHKITGFKDELDNADKAEVFQFMKSYQEETLEEILPEEPGPPVSIAPYLFDPERVFAAIYSDSRNVANDTIEPWTALPPMVAVEVFRDMLSLERFNDLYRPEEPFVEQQAHTFPFLENFRPEFNRRMRNLGTLSFQVGRHRDGRMLKVGDRWDVEDIEILPVRDLRNSKVLRDRGIRVIASGFPELNPAHPGVREQLAAYWSAHWTQEVAQIEAEHLLEAKRLQAKARADAQREMVELLRRIYNLPDLSQAALVMRLFQALESVAGEPRTRQLLPADSIGFLWDLREFLVP